MKTLYSKFLILVASATIFMAGCKKDEETKPEPDQSAINNYEAEAQFNDLDNLDQAVFNSFPTDQELGLRGARTDSASEDTRGCGIVTINTETKTITVDYGTGTQGCKDRKIRAGKIIIKYTGRYSKPGSVITTTTENYTINGVKVEGTKVVTNTSNFDSKIYSHTIKVTNGKLTYPNGAVATWESTRTRTWSKGFETLFDLRDDETSVTGQASGVNTKGQAYTVQITNPLIYKTTCMLGSFIFQPSAGTLIITNQNGTATVDYGQGDCDKLFTVEAAGRIFTVEGGQ